MTYLPKAAGFFLAFACACHKHEVASTAAPPPSETTSVAAPAPIASATSAAEARRQAIREAAEAGVLHLGADDGTNVPLGREDTLPTDALMGGDGYGGDAGAGGGLGTIGALGRDSTGTSRPRVGAARGPKLRQGAATVSGHLPGEVVQRIVRQNFGRFRLCYEHGLRTDPSLHGVVATSFVIDAQGSVSSASSEPATTMPDPGVVSCVTRAFLSLSFPQPEGGVVVVVYPVVFDPGDPTSAAP